MRTKSPAHTKVSRADWIAAAAESLTDVPIDQLRVLTLASELSVSRSSFYWYFQNMQELHDELLARWDRNTQSIVERTERPSDSIVEACLGVFECWADTRLYDVALDLAVRDWGRRNDDVTHRVVAADERRIDALKAMFSAHGFRREDAIVRARLVYHSQVGYYAVGTDEPIEDRLTYLPYYLEAMTGSAPSAEELAAFKAVLLQVP